MKSRAFQVAVGTWTQQGNDPYGAPQAVARTVAYDGPDLGPLCRPSTVVYALAGRNGVREGKTVFRVSNQLRVTDWDADVAEAKSSGASCN